MSLNCSNQNFPCDRPQNNLDGIVVSAAQTSAIEQRLFDGGMPVAALMEKVAARAAARLRACYGGRRVGVLVGPGHNGGDALVVARELHHWGYEVAICRPLEKSKSLTQAHLNYARHLGLPVVDTLEALPPCDWFVDGLFGFGLERPLEGELAALVRDLNDRPEPVASLDLPSGLHTDRGCPLGTAVRADRTLCLGLWKWAVFQDTALPYLGRVERLDFDIPVGDVAAVVSGAPAVRILTPATARGALPLPRSPLTYKYKEGHLLVVAGSRRYTGAAILTGLGARASGVGMLTLAVPEDIKPLLGAQLPEALVVGCPQTPDGAIDRLPDALDLDDYDAIACGPGLTTAAAPVVEQLLSVECPLLLDADGLNLLAASGRLSPETEDSESSAARISNIGNGPRILTPHPGEFARLFPGLKEESESVFEAARTAAARSGAIVVYKGARPVVAHADGRLWLLKDSTPALARGGTGDVLSGLIGGLAATAAVRDRSLPETVAVGVWWHARAGMLAATARSQLGVDASTLAAFLDRVPAELWEDADLGLRNG